MLVGDRVKCDAKGTPPPKITLRVGRDLDVDGPEYEFLEKDRGSLTVVCIAKNLYGSMTSKIVITVSGDLSSSSSSYSSCSSSFSSSC